MIIHHLKLRLILVVLALFQCLSVVVFAQNKQQNRVVKFAYDGNGNRYRQWVEVLKVTVADSNDLQAKDSIEMRLIGGSKEINSMSLLLYPNPTHGQLDLKITGMQQGETAEYSFLSISGVELLHGKTNLPLTRIDITSYPPGTYFARVVLGKCVQGWKLVKIQ